MRIHSQKDFAAGLLYIVVGAVFSILAHGYRMGTASRMGPGYFPFWLGILLAVIGIAVLFGAMRNLLDSDEHRLRNWDFKSLLLILASVVLFGVLLEPMGLAFSVAATVLVASLASHEFGLTAALANAVVLVALSIGIFVLGLGLEFNLLPAFMAG